MRYKQLYYRKEIIKRLKTPSDRQQSEWRFANRSLDEHGALSVSISTIAGRFYFHQPAAGVTLWSSTSGGAHMRMRTMCKALVLSMALSGIAVLSATPLSAQGTATPKFEVVSVKPCAPGDGASRAQAGQRGAGSGGGGYVTTSPGRLYVNCMTVATMINIYLINGPDRLINDSSMPDDPRRVRGGPAWVHSDRYTIDAETSDRAAAGPTEAPTPGTFIYSDANRLLMGPMFRALLEDRFQLRTHRDTEEVAMYSLSVAKGGLKVKPMEEGGCVPLDPTKNRPGDIPPGGKPWCIQGIGFAGSDWTINGSGQPISSFAAALSTVMGRHVFDKTGLSDLFNYNLRFAHDDTTPGEFPPGLPSLFPQSDVPAGPSVFTVLEEQLGLKLVPDKGRREYLVIDSIQRPTEN
jgi:uncharacterized protein (TIGR03435 family)